RAPCRTRSFRRDLWMVPGSAGIRIRATFWFRIGTRAHGCLVVRPRSCTRDHSVPTHDGTAHALVPRAGRGRAAAAGIFNWDGLHLDSAHDGRLSPWLLNGCGRMKMKMV